MTDKKDKEKLTLAEKYKLKGAQSMTLTEYEALKAKGARATRLRVPTFAKFILGTPFIIVFCCGIVFIPYILYLILTSPQAPPPTDDIKKTNATTR